MLYINLREHCLNIDINLFLYDIGDIVFCYYQELLYEAIIRDRRWRKDGVGEYYIHYINWKKNWDEWVDYQNVLVINEVNISHKEFLEKEL
jgi:Fe-S cluster biosynthesis and repair protein YggX